jgi:hypothetical protein
MMFPCLNLEVSSVANYSAILDAWIVSSECFLAIGDTVDGDKTLREARENACSHGIIFG